MIQAKSYNAASYLLLSNVKNIDFYTRQNSNLMLPYTWASHSRMILSLAFAEVVIKCSVDSDYLSFLDCEKGGTRDYQALMINF
jgi:hypothetical protein